jgi:hypothetical protein
MDTKLGSSREGDNLVSNTNSIILALIIGIGFLGNALNLIVFRKKALRRIETFRYLSYLSIFDILVLAIGALDILVKDAFNFEIRTYSSLTCKMHTFATYTVTHMSSILLMSVSVNRAFKMVNMKMFNNKSSLNRLNECEGMKLIKHLNSKKEVNLLDSQDVFNAL